jgi:hypothetical protein
MNHAMNTASVSTLQHCMQDRLSADRGADGRVATGTPGAASGVPGGIAAGSGRTGAQLGASAARAEDVSIHMLAAAAGLSSSREHQIVAASLNELDAALGELRVAPGRPGRPRWR